MRPSARRDEATTRLLAIRAGSPAATFGARGHELLTDEQIARIDEIYHGEKDARLAELLPSLNTRRTTQDNG